MAVHRVLWLHKQRQAATMKLDRHEAMRTGLKEVKEQKIPGKNLVAAAYHAAAMTSRQDVPTGEGALQLPAPQVGNGLPDNALERRSGKQGAGSKNRLWGAILHGKDHLQALQSASQRTRAG